MLTSWLRPEFTRRSRSRRRGVAPIDRSCRPKLETLEERLAPAFVVGALLRSESDPGAIAAGDFNGDGYLDLAAATRASGNVGVFLGNGNSTFDPARSFFVGTNPASIAAADFDADGKLDLAVTNNPDGVNGQVSVLLGNGDGTFQAAQVTTAGAAPVAMAAADFNGDHQADVAVVDFNQDRVSVLLGNGDASFQPAKNFAVGEGPVSIAVGDFSGDGQPDLIVANSKSGNFSLLIGNSNGSFQPAEHIAVSASPQSLVAADFNRDRKSDVAVANSDGNVSVLLGNGNGTFKPAKTFAAGEQPTSVAAGDFNGDRKLDLAVAGQTGNVTMLAGNGFGSFTLTQTLATGAAATSTVAGDFNGDGKSDVFAADPLGDTLTLIVDAAPVKFGDPDLAAAVRLELGLAAEAVINTNDMLKLTKLSADSLLITNLLGLEKARDLRSLQLAPNNFSDASGRKDRLTSLAPLRLLSKLESLTVLGAGLTGISAAQLPRFGNLKLLDVRYNRLRSVGFAPAIPGLQTLHVYGNSITNYLPLKGKFIKTDLLPVGLEQADTVAEVAKALHYLPLDIYEYMLNNFRYQIYSGMMKGAQAALETKAGSTLELANLLVELLRSSRVTARFVRGRIEADRQAVMNWLGVTDPEAAFKLLVGTPEKVLDDGGAITGFRFDKFWVEAALPKPGGGQQWVGLDPSWKFRDFQPGIRGLLNLVPFDAAAENDYLSQTRKETTAEWYENRAEEYLAAYMPGTTLADVPYDGPIRPQIIDRVPTKLPFALIGTPTSFDKTTPTQAARVDLTLKQGSTELLKYRFNVPEVSLRRITVSFDGTNAFNLVPVIRVDGIAVARGTKRLTYGSTITTVVDHLDPGDDVVDQSYTDFRAVGQYLAFGLNAQQITEKLLTRHQAAVNKAGIAKINGQPFSLEDQIGSLLALGVAKYFKDSAHGDGIIGALTGAAQSILGVESGWAYTYRAITDFPDLQNTAIPNNPTLDIGRLAVAAQPIDNDSSRDQLRHRLRGFDGSTQEHTVWETLLNAPSISTIKSLQLARERGIPIITITAANSWQIGQLNQPQSVKDSLTADVNRGATIEIPRDPTPLDRWTGVGWTSSESGFRISGGLNGGAYGGVPLPAPLSPHANTRPNQFYAGDPVNIANGNVTRDETDIVLPGAGMPIQFARHYDSRSNNNVFMGIGWVNTYSHFLSFDDDGKINWITDNGNRHTFTPIGGGNYSTPNTIHGTFTAISGGYRFRNKDGTTHTFDVKGRLMTIEDRYGNGVQLTWEGTIWKLLSVHDIANPTRRLTFTHANGRIVGVSDHTGRTWKYRYSADNQLIEVTGPSDALTKKAVVKYSYYTDKALKGLIKQITLPDGGTINYTYYPNRRAFQVTDQDGFTQTFDYNLFRMRTSFTDERGFTTEHDYNNDGNLLQTIHPDRSREKFVWSNNLMTSSTDAYGKTETYQYDAMGNLTQVVDRAGNATTFTYESTFNQPTQVTRPGGRTTRFTYDAAGNLTQIEDALGNKTAMTYDARGQMLTRTTPRGVLTPQSGDFTTTFTYNDAGQVLSRSTDLPSTETMTYDDRGNLLTSTDALGRTTTYEYDLMGRVVQLTEAAGFITQNAYDVMGNLIAGTDPLGRKATFVYDRKQRLIRSQAADGTLQTQTHDALGNLVLQTDSLGRKVRTTYDSRNRQFRTVAPDGTYAPTDYNGGGRVASVTDALGNATRFEYDVLGRLVSTIDALGGTTTRTYDAVGNLLAVTDPLGRTTQYQYDLLNRRTAVIDPLGNTATTTFDPNGNVASVSDPLNQTTLFQYDVLDRQTATVDALGQTTSTSYDAAGNMIAFTDPRGNVTAYAYDNLDRLVSETAGALPPRQFAYDAVGNLTSAVDRNGRTRRFIYDLQDRLTSEQWLDASANVVRRVRFSFDAAGQMTSAGDPDSLLRFEYDDLGRQTSVDNSGTPGSPRVEFDYSYDAAGRRIAAADRIVGQDAGIETRTYDALDRVTSITQSGDHVAYKRVEFEYDAAGQTKLIDRFNSPAGSSILASQIAFDNAGRLSALTHRVPDGAILANYAWTFDAASRITQTTDVDGTTINSYDDTDQLTAADHTGQADETYTYDAAGNRTNAGYSTGTLNRMTSDGVHAYQYDNEGNLIRRTKIATSEVTEFEWDHRNRLTRVVFKNAGANVVKEVHYTYDAFDRRIAKSVDADGAGGATPTIERFVYDGDQIALVFDGEGKQLHRYLYGPRVDQVLADENAAGDILWPLADNQGTVRDLVSSAGTLLNHIRYDSFGRVTSQTNPAVTIQFGYTGRDFDVETGLNYYRARYYDPATGRFLSEDPSGFAAGDANLYRYVGNNSVNFVDPFGLEKSSTEKRNDVLLAGIGFSEAAPFTIVADAILLTSQAAVTNMFSILVPNASAAINIGIDFALGGLDLNSVDTFRGHDRYRGLFGGTSPLYESMHGPIDLKHYQAARNTAIRLGGGIPGFIGSQVLGLGVEIKQTFVGLVGLVATGLGIEANFGWRGEANSAFNQWDFLSNFIGGVAGATGADFYRPS